MKPITNFLGFDFKLVSFIFPLWTAASEETDEDLDKDDEADEEDDQDEADHVQQIVLRPGQVKGGRSGEGYDDDDDDVDDDDGDDVDEGHLAPGEVDQVGLLITQQVHKNLDL